VEPAAASNGATVVAAVQSGRFYTSGASDIGFATSFDAGVTWHAGTLPAVTRYTLPRGPYDSASDPSVAYDAAHGTWLIAAIPIRFEQLTVSGVLVSRSADGVTWSDPVTVASIGDLTDDKSWIACDNHAASPYYGRCYIEWDYYSGSAGVIDMSVSTDGGQTWSAPAHPNRDPGGLGGQPVVEPSGTVVVTIDDVNETHVLAFSSSDGGTTWSTPVTVSSIADHLVAGNLRTSPLISASADAAGKIYVVWQDCRFRMSCASNDLVMSTSTDGVSWTAPARIPIDDRSSAADHFIPGLNVEPGTSGATASLALTYYSYSNTQCTGATCALFANFIASPDGGATWTAPQTLAGPMNLQWLARTNEGVMVGDYVASTFALGRPIAFLAVAGSSTGATFNEATYVSTRGIAKLGAALRRTSHGERPVPGFHSDHGLRHFRP
jgi:hypothetical protein